MQPKTWQEFFDQMTDAEMQLPPRAFYPDPAAEVPIDTGNVEWDRERGGLAIDSDNWSG